MGAVDDRNIWRAVKKAIGTVCDLTLQREWVKLSQSTVHQWLQEQKWKRYTAGCKYAQRYRHMPQNLSAKDWWDKQTSPKAVKCLREKKGIPHHSKQSTSLWNSAEVMSRLARILLGRGSLIFIDVTRDGNSKMNSEVCINTVWVPIQRKTQANWLGKAYIMRPDNDPWI